MDGLLKKIYNKPENVPEDVCAFLTALYSAYPPRCIRKGETLEDAHRYAGLAEATSLGMQWLLRK